MSDWFVYPAIFHCAEDGISVRFPDLEGCFTYGNDECEAFNNAKEALGLHLYGIESDNEKFPLPTQIQNIKLSENEIAGLIQIYMPAFRHDISIKAVKKTLAIPRWLDDLGKENDVNFSAILQEALKKHLGV